jgi:hypothetical protein
LIITAGVPSFTHTGIGVLTGGEQLALDWDGDGLPDLVSLSGSNVSVRRNITTPGGAVTFAPTAMPIYTTAGSYISNSSIVDFDGDGRMDLVLSSYNPGCMQACGPPSLVALFSNGFSAQPTALTFGTYVSQVQAFGDWNGDGCTDIITLSTVYVSNCARGFTAMPTGITAASSPIAIDWDGDGMVDLVYTNQSNNTLYVAKSTGTGIGASISTGIPSPATATFFGMDQDADGQRKSRVPLVGRRYQNLFSQRAIYAARLS